SRSARRTTTPPSSSTTSTTPSGATSTRSRMSRSAAWRARPIGRPPPATRWWCRSASAGGASPVMPVKLHLACGSKVLPVMLVLRFSHAVRKAQNKRNESTALPKAHSRRVQRSTFIAPLRVKDMEKPMLVLGSKTIIVDGITVFADHADPNQFWFLPGPVSLDRRDGGDSAALSLILYKPAAVAAGVKGGGFLTFETWLHLDPARERKILARLSEFSL